MTGSDSQTLDNMLEVLLAGGLDPLHAMRLLIPPAWQTVDTIDPDLRAFYEYYATHMEPWDGPAGIVLTDGRYALCTLDRNGLRPARYVITRNRHLTVASETGVWDYAPEDVVRKGRLGPGEMLALDLQTGQLHETKQIDDILKSRHPYKAWLKKGVRYLETDLIDRRLAAEPFDRETLALYQKMFNITAEERDEIIRVLAEDESEAVGSMGDDTPMPVLSSQGAIALRLFPTAVRAGHESADRSAARVDRHVAADADRPGVRTSSCRPPEHAKQIVMNSPILSQRKLRQILGHEGLRHHARIPRSAVRTRGRAEDGDPAGSATRPSRPCARAGWCCSFPIAISCPARFRCTHYSSRAPCTIDSSRRACAPSATSWSRPARRAIRIISPVSSASARRPCIRTWRTRRSST